MSYSTLDGMYQDLGLDMSKKLITYSLLGEMEYSTVVARGVKPGSSYAEQMGDAVNIGELLVDRSIFHGHGPVLIDTVEEYA